jgi:hypothetical protein
LTISINAHILIPAQQKAGQLIKQKAFSSEIAVFDWVLAQSLQAYFQPLV